MQLSALLWGFGFEGLKTLNQNVLNIYLIFLNILKKNCLFVGKIFQQTFESNLCTYIDTVEKVCDLSEDLGIEIIFMQFIHDFQ